MPNWGSPALCALILSPLPFPHTDLGVDGRIARMIATSLQWAAHGMRPRRR